MSASDEVAGGTEAASMEVELSAEDLLALSQAPRIMKPEPAVVAPPPAPAQSPLIHESKPRLPQVRTASPSGGPRRVIARATLFVGLTIPALVAGVYFVPYEKSGSARPSLVPNSSEQWKNAESSSAELEPVRFANPFDASEVFEFPPGTTEAEARDEVRRMLTERAMQRRS